MSLGQAKITREPKKETVAEPMLYGFKPSFTSLYIVNLPSYTGYFPLHLDTLEKFPDYS
jgi:hypothetical protein